MIETSVVIPTAGRRPQQLRQALASVQAQQDCGPLEVVIVDDSIGSLDLDQFDDQISGLEIRIVQASDHPNLAQRSVGVEYARGMWIAFLDDDDLWAPNKLVEQLKLARAVVSQGRRPIVSSRVTHTFDHNDARVGGVPARLIDPSGDVSDYLFHRRAASTRRPSLFTSTIVVEREVARAVPWRRLPRHQDWDWLLRAARHPGAVVLHHPDDLTVIHVGSSGSITASNDWAQSLGWASAVLDEGLLTPQAYVDFLLGQTFRYAVGARSLRGVIKTVAGVVRARKLPSSQALVIGMAGMLPRSTLQRAMATQWWAPSRRIR